MPKSEVAYKIVVSAQRFYERRFQVNVVMPFAGGIVDESIDKLNFTDDYLANAIKAVGYTVEKGRMYWLGSSDVTPSVKWYGKK